MLRLAFIQNTIWAAGCQQPGWKWRESIVRGWKWKKKNACGIDHVQFDFIFILCIFYATGKGRLILPISLFVQSKWKYLTCAGVNAHAQSPFVRCTIHCFFPIFIHANAQISLCSMKNVHELKMFRSNKLPPSMTKMMSLHHSIRCTQFILSDYQISITEPRSVVHILRNNQSRIYMAQYKSRHTPDDVYEYFITLSLKKLYFPENSFHHAKRRQL